MRTAFLVFLILTPLLLLAQNSDLETSVTMMTKDQFLQPSQFFSGWKADCICIEYEWDPADMDDFSKWRLAEPCNGAR